MSVRCEMTKVKEDNQEVRDKSPKFREKYRKLNDQLVTLKRKLETRDKS